MESFILIIILCGIALILLTLPGSFELLWLTFGGLLPTRSLPSVNKKLQHIAIIIPAHNEASDIARCVHSLQRCTPPLTPYSIYVIADNCTDDTAQQAQLAGASVLIRQDENKRGKGYALDYAFTHLFAQNIDAVLIIDADTVVETNFICACEQVFLAGAEALQCRYVVNNPYASFRTRVMHIALLAFNVLRLRGRERWGLSVGISGNGFGVRKQTIQTVPYCASSVVEDLEYHLSLVRAGIRVWFVDNTTVKADMPTLSSSSATQRARWEGGRLRMMRENIPRLTVALFKGQWRTFEPLLDLLLLPLAIHVLLLILLLIIPFSWTQLYAFVGLSIVALHVVAAIIVGGGQWRDIATLTIVPFYIIWKLTQIPKLIKAARKSAQWIRTDREPPKE